MEDINEKILWEGYGLRFRGGTRTRTGLICRTDQGLRELKKPRGSAENLRLALLRSAIPNIGKTGAIMEDPIPDAGHAVRNGNRG